MQLKKWRNYLEGGQNGRDNMTPEDIELRIRRLLKFEPKCSVFYRLSIILYELGDLAKNLCYSHRFPNYPENDAKLAVADLVTMVHALCIEQGWDFESLRELGVKHLEQRYQEFSEKGWKELENI